MIRAARTTAAIVLVIVLVVSCGGNDNATPTSTLPATTLPTPSTTSPSTSPPPDTTAATTTSTLPATTTTVDETAATKASVAAAAVQSREDYLYAVQNYDALDALEVLGRSHAAGSPAYQRGVENIDNLRANGWRVRPNPNVPSALSVEGDVVLLDGPPATKAEATVCEIGAGIVYEPGAGPDGADAIVNDEINARRTRVTIILEDGVWKLQSGEELGSWNGQTSCPAA